MDARRWGCFFLALVMQFSLASMSRAEAAATDRLKLLLAAPWYGSYVCNQGLTRLQLNLRPLQENDPRQLTAEFVFSADPDAGSEAGPLAGPAGRPELSHGRSGRETGSRRRSGHDPGACDDLWLSGFCGVAVFFGRGGKPLGKAGKT